MIIMYMIDTVSFKIKIKMKTMHFSPVEINYSTKQKENHGKGWLICIQSVIKDVKKRHVSRLI